uniref:Cytochrome P450 n=1 Tax=Acrobeloides nanus TaxID=290746 RepID=A0A914EL70_9BILA
MASNYVRVLGTPWQLLIQKKVEIFKYVPFFRKYYYALKDARDVLMKFYKRQVKEHQENADNDSEPTDFVEAFLREKARREADGQQDKIYTMEQLLIMCWDLWVAGQDTTSNTMIWGILYLMTEPEIQAKLHKELDSVVGSDRIITMEDRSKLHYAAAVINEIQRIVNLMPLNHRRSTTRDVEIHGFHLPEGTEIIPQISTVLYDEQFLVAPNKPPTLQRKFGQAVTPQPFVCNIERRY